MDPKYQQDLGTSGEYTPSARAKKAMSSSQGQSSHQVAGDAPSASQATESRSGKEGDMPKQTTGGKPPAGKDQGGTDKLSNARSFGDDKA
jgi:hypothetical protein